MKQNLAILLIPIVLVCTGPYLYYLCKWNSYPTRDSWARELREYGYVVPDFDRGPEPKRTLNVALLEGESLRIKQECWLPARPGTYLALSWDCGDTMSFVNSIDDAVAPCAIDFPGSDNPEKIKLPNNWVPFGKPTKIWKYQNPEGKDVFIRLRTSYVEPKLEANAER